MLKKLFYLFSLLVLTSTSHAQFTTTGDASTTTCNCFEVTDDAADELGSFYKTAAINLTTDFHFKFSVNFGCENTGGEGLAFVMQTAAWDVGNDGYGIGYEDITGNSLSIEFDTRDNEASGEIDNWDVPSDHISLQDNGDIDHEMDNPNNLLGDPSGLNAGEDATPHPIKPGFPNVEDCEDHVVEVLWTAGVNQTIQVKIDGITTMTYIGDMIADQFDGNANVLWGWTGSTGVFSNVQTVCAALIPDFSYTPTNCPGEEIDFTDLSCAFYTITDWDWDFDGLGTSTAEDPSFTFTDAGSYPVELTITDSEGCENNIIIEIPVGFETETSVDDATICVGESTIIHAEGNPFVETECCFKLVLNDLWGDYWGSGTANELEIILDGVSFGFYTPTSFDPGAGTSDTIDLCFDQDAELEFIIHGEDSPAECSYFFLTDDLTELISVDGALGGTWVDGANEFHTVDCGLDPPEYDYLWDNAPLLSDETDPDPTATIVTDTWFHVDITDVETGCTIVDSILVSIHPPVDAVISGDNTTCEGDTSELVITFTGPAPYDLDITGPSGPLPTITDIPGSPYLLDVAEDGDYVITYVTGDACEGTFSGTGTVTVIVPFAVEIEASAEHCDGDPIVDLTVVSTNGGTVNWYDNPGLIPPEIGTGLTLTPGGGVGTTTYYAAETEGVFGCEGPGDEVTITIYPIPPAPAYTGDTEFCEGDDATDIFGEPSLGGEITWYDNPPPGGAVLETGTSFTPPLIAPGITIYLTETAYGCESPATEVIITVNPTPDPPAVVGDTEYCEGDVPTPITAITGSGGDIEWRTDVGVLLTTGTTFTPTLVVGTTTILVYEVLGGCISDPTEIEIVVDEFPTISIPENLSVCRGDSILVTATNNGYDIIWSDGQTGESVWLKPDATASHTATATNPSCGSATDELLLTVNELPEIITSSDTVVGIGGEVKMWASSEDATLFTWSPAIYECITPNCSEVYAVPDRATVYVVTVTDDNGCMNTDTIFVDINGIMEVFVPNVFSPNGDGSNDYLVVHGPRLFEFKIEIYDRWGKKIYQTEEQKEYWDGTFNDKILPPQTFVYIITGITVLGEEVRKEGNTTIIK